MKLSHIYIVCAAALLTTACTSEAEQTSDVAQGSQKQMTFTVSQEGDSGAKTRVAFNNETKLIWETGDKIGIYDGTSTNLPFTLIGNGGTTIGAFKGEAQESGSYTAVYPYSADMTISDGSATGVTLPATQTATPGSFDKNAAIFMAKSTDKKLEFKTAVGFVKVTPQFACSKIELKAPTTSVILSGTGTVSYNAATPTLNLSSNTSSVITLLPKSGDVIEANKSYYIVVPAQNLGANWSITFTATNDKVFTRKSSKVMKIVRNEVVNIGTFSKTDYFWELTDNGNVEASMQVDIGLTINLYSRNYKVIFAKRNLTNSGLATKESAFGDHYVMGASSPWYNSYTYNSSTNTLIVNSWNRSGGYTESNCPAFDDDSYFENDVLKLYCDAARYKLSGDWQIPNKEVWTTLYDANGSSVIWEITTIDEIVGYKIKNARDNSKYIFLPASGIACYDNNINVASEGGYLTRNRESNENAYFLRFEADGYVSEQDYDNMAFGYSIRPVRLIDITD